MKAKHTPRLIALFLCAMLLLTACKLPFGIQLPWLTNETWDMPDTPRRTISYGDMDYARPDLDGMRRRLTGMTASLQAAGSYDAVLDISEECGEMFEEFNTMYTLAMLAKYHDVNDIYFEEEYRLLDEASVELGILLNDYYRAILDGPYAAQYREEIGDYQYASIQNDLLLSSPEVEAYKKERSELNADYNKLLATVGEGSYAEHAPQFAAMYARMIELDKLCAETLGFASAAEMYYLSYSRDYTPEEGMKLCENSKRYFVPLLPVVISEWYTSGPMDMDEAFEKMPAALGKVDPQLREAFEFMTEYGLYDCAPAEGKQSGIAFCTDLYAYDSGFIYSYWDDSFSSLTTLTHEFGHYYDYWLRYDEGVVFNLDIAETYSQSLELLMHPYYREFTDKASANEAVMENLQSFALNVLVYQCLLEEFQHRVYALEVLDEVSIGRVYASLLEEYGLWPSTDENGADHSWYRVTHLFDAPFYTISYVTSAVAALQIWAESQEDHGAAVSTYLNMIHADQNQSFTSLLQSVGLRPVHTPAVLEEIAGYFRKLFAA